MSALLFVALCVCLCACESTTPSVSPGIWELDAPATTDEGFVVQLSDEQHSAAQSASYTIVKKATEGYHPVLVDAPIPIGEDGRIVVPADPLVLSLVTNGGDGHVLTYATCEATEADATRYTSDRVRLCATVDLGRSGSPAGGDWVTVEAVFAADGTRQEVQLTRENPCYPLEAEVTKDEQDLYQGLYSAFRSSLSKARAEDGTMAPVRDWPDGGTTDIRKSYCDEGFEVCLEPLSIFDETCYVQVTVTDESGAAHATDLSEPFCSYEPLPRAEVATEQGNLTFLLTEDHAQLITYEGTDVELAIPEQVEGLPVTGIDPHVFKGNETLHTVALPDSITSIGGSAFRSTRITQLTLPASLQYLGPGAFADMKRLERFKQKGEGDLISVRDGVLFSADGTTLLAYPSAKGDDYTVPDGVTTIGHAAFADADLTQVALPDSLVEIEPYAFVGCRNLTSIKLPDNVEQIGAGAFGLDASWSDEPASMRAPVDKISLGPKVRFVGIGAFDGLALESIEVDRKNRWYQSQNGFLISTDGILVQAPASLWGVVVVPDGVTRLAVNSLTNILNGTQANTLSQADVTLPESLVAIDEDALPIAYESDELSIESIERVQARFHVPQGSWAESYALEHDVAYDYDCQPEATSPHETTVELPKATLGFVVYDDHAVLVSLNATTAGHVAVPEKVDGVSVTVVGEDSNATTSDISGEVATLVLPGSVRQVDSTFLSSIGSLCRIHLEHDNDFLSEQDGVLYSADGSVLIACPRAYDTSFAVPEGTREIGEHAFYESEITQVTLPDGLERIGTYAFGRARDLTSISLPDSLRSIGAGAFSYSGLTHVELNEGLQTIGTCAFESLKGYQGLRIPDSVTAIGRDAFAARTSSEEPPAAIGSDTLRLGKNLETVGQGAFAGLDTASFEVDRGNTHFSADGPLLLSGDGRTLLACSSAVAGELRIPEGVEAIAGSTFNYTPRITDLYLPTSLLRLEGYSVFASSFSIGGTQVLHCPAGSEAAQIAKDKGLSYVEE